MESLDHMLTEPLVSGMDYDGCVMEECMLGNCRVRIPEDFLEDVSNKIFWYFGFTDIPDTIVVCFTTN